MFISPHLNLLLLKWRRRGFFFRRFSMSKCVAFFLVFLFLLGNIPNPWSTEYEFVEIEQAIQWQDVSDLFQAKNKVRRANFIDD